MNLVGGLTGLRTTVFTELWLFLSKIVCGIEEDPFISTGSSYRWISQLGQSFRQSPSVLFEGWLHIIIGITVDCNAARNCRWIHRPHAVQDSCSELSKTGGTWVQWGWRSVRHYLRARSRWSNSPLYNLLIRDLEPSCGQCIRLYSPSTWRSLPGSQHIRYEQCEVVAP